MKNKIIIIIQLLFVLLFCAPMLYAQKSVGEIFTKSTTRTISIDDESLSTKKSTRSQLSIDLGEYGVYDLDLEPTSLFSDNYIAKNKDNGKLPKTFKGTVQGQSNTRVSLTTNGNFLSGFIDTGEEVVYFEPYKNFNANAVENELIIYYQKDVIDQGHTCAANHTKQQTGQLESQNDNQLKSANTCTYEVEMVLVADYAMYQNHGNSTTQTLSHITSVLNNAANNYDDEFNDAITFTVVDSYIADSASDDLWSSETDAGKLLGEFAGSNISSVGYDLASLWVTRDITGTNEDGTINSNVVGLAYNPGVCGSRYNLIEDYTSSAASLRVVFAHEIGHNFGADHDPSGSGNIMAPAVNITDTWSEQSQCQINNFYPGATCLCASGDMADLIFRSCGSVSLNGDILTVSDVEVQNIGTTSTGTNVSTRWYLSTDNIIDVNDYPITTRLAVPHSSGSYSIYDFDIDLTTTSAPPGNNYYLGAITDYDNTITEFSEDNNIGCIVSLANIPAGAGCVMDYTLPYDDKEEDEDDYDYLHHDVDEDFEAANSITSHKKIPSGVTVSYDAGNIIRLKPCFHAQPGSNFHAFIDGCQDTSVPKEDTSLAPDIQLYPNPATHTISVEYELSQNTSANISIFDAFGKVVKNVPNTELFAGKQTLNMDISNLPAGMYFYTLQAEDWKATKKFIIVSN